MNATAHHFSFWPWIRIPVAVLSMREIAEQVANERGMLPDELRGPRRLDPIVQARQEAMRRMYRSGRFTTTQIGRFFNRDHTTVCYSVKAAEARLTV